VKAKTTQASSAHAFATPNVISQFILFSSPF
jgi:hypothetical protein